MEILNQQKSESQTQLDSLDNERSKYEIMVKDIQSKCYDEAQSLSHIKAQLASQDTSVKEQEGELQKGRKELEELQTEEARLEMQVEKNKKELESLKNRVAANNAEISQVIISVKVKFSFHIICDCQSGKTNHLVIRISCKFLCIFFKIYIYTINRGVYCKPSFCISRPPKIKHNILYF